MRPRARTALGIDIGSRRISAALVEKTEGGVKVLASATGELPAPQDSLTSGKALLRVLRKLGMRARVRGAEVAVAVSTGSAMVRLLDLPKPMPANLREFVENELKQYVTLSGKTMTWDFCGIGAVSGARKRLLAVAADSEEARETLKACEAAGVAVGGVDLAAVAYLRAFLADGAGAGCNRHAVVAILSRANLIMCVVRKGALDFVRFRDLPGGMDSPESLGAWLTEELNAVLRYCCVDSSDERSEWRTSLMIHDAPYSKEEIVPLLALEQRGKSLEVLDCSEPGGTGGGEIEGACTTAYAVAVGAALRLLDLEGDELRIDLMPQEMIQAKALSRHALALANVAAIVFIAIFLVIQLLARTGDARHRRIERARIAGEVPTMPALAQEDWYLDREIAQVQEQLNRLKAARTERQVDWPAVLGAIWETRPPGTVVTQIMCNDGRTLVVEGIAPSPAETRAFVRGLDGRSSLASIWLARVERRLDDGDAVDFEINCAVRSAN